MIDRTKKVYFAKCVGPTGEPIGAYKIGCSHGWNERIKQVASNMPFTLEVEALVTGGFVMEKAIHLCLKKLQISGEYFHARDEVLEFVERCATKGSPFIRISDSGEDHFPDGALHAFLGFHGVSIAEACDVLGIREKEYLKRVSEKGYKSNKVVAAASLVAARRGQFVNWPGDALRGLLGEKAPQLVESEAA